MPIIRINIAAFDVEVSASRQYNKDISQINYMKLFDIHVMNYR